MTSDDDEELELDDDGTLHGTHAEDATIFTLPPSPVTSYEPATKPSELPVKSEAPASVTKPKESGCQESCFSIGEEGGGPCEEGGSGKEGSSAKKAAPAKKAPTKKASR